MLLSCFFIYFWFVYLNNLVNVAPKKLDKITEPIFIKKAKFKKCLFGNAIMVVVVIIIAKTNPQIKPKVSL